MLFYLHRRRPSSICLPQRKAGRPAHPIPPRQNRPQATDMPYRPPVPPR